MNERSLRPLDAHDLAALCSLERDAHPLGWSEEALLVELVHPDAVVLGAFLREQLVAYVAARDIVDERWILNIATATTHRRAGHARSLLDAVAALPRPTSSLWLEVRESNDAARALYLGLGFIEVGKRPGYYPCADGGREAAVLMRRGVRPDDAGSR